MENIYHEGEKEVQRKAGEEIQANSNGRIVTDSIIKGAINFIEKQPMAIVSSADQQGKLWTSLLIGDLGFVSVPSPNRISFDRNMIYSDPNDVFFDNIESQPFLGSLFIELSTRRRFRVNGRARTDLDKIDVDIWEAYPNCPKYIQQRVVSTPEKFQKTVAGKDFGTTFTAAISAWIASSDTLFVGSQSKDQRLDASHRGGQPGFVEVLDGQTLKIPDYRGNSMYNTLGNMVQNPNAGLLFIDFEQQKTLQLTGKAEVFFDQNSADDLSKTGGTGRYWLFTVSDWVITHDHHTVHWEFMSYSPFNPAS
ncbi:pyridoxamine 5'-phosphate oxidase family protein [Rapidithrix thailandica]|uniref:Pyridoxamine 5'-phosphate oxidase family protein n=1 Tax=Rapidithrix thailandica TaxID=413964 RepID=A0AAW9SAP0_9BACT